MRFILVVHCETDWNQAKRFQGHTDIPLNDDGRSQARELAQKLQADSLQPTVVLTSTLSRARETGEIIAGYFNLTIKSDERLRECCFGKLEGLTRDEIFKQHGEFSLTYLQYDLRRFAGENREDVLARHLDFIKEFSERHPKETPLLVGHRRGFNTLLGGLGFDVVNNPLARGEYRIVDYQAV
ncbi:histidine phosphatase family protein [Candidatus Uhrbacteria bacterium]|nr:histidine phosphatase family protein [Candidatus Uhrbacteria bacterium]